MKKSLTVFVLLFSVCFFLGCEREYNLDEFYLIGIINNVEEKINIEVIESEYAFGEYLVITSNETNILDKKGLNINKNNLKVGDKIKVVYSGQVMMSFPPQIVAYEIKII